MKPWLLPAALALASAAHGAENCEALRAQVESKISAAGVARFTLLIVDANAPATGQVVGSCELGSKKIVYLREGGPAPAAAGSGSSRPAGNSSILTECKDGTVSIGGDCSKR